MTSVAMRDYAHADVMWGVGADTSTRIDSDTRCLTMGQALIERPDLDTLVDGTLLQREQGSLTPIGPILRDIEQFVVAYFSAQLRQGMGRQFTDADFGADPVLAKLDELASLPLGWEYGKGRATLPHVSQMARAIYRDLAPFQLQADAFPCADGSLHLVFYAGLRSVELRIEADRTIDLSMEEKRGDYFEELMSREDISKHEITNQVLHLLYHQELFQWESSDSLIHGTMIAERANLTVHALPTQATEPAYHWWKQTVFK